MTIRQATVFGGSGFVGRYVVRALAATGARVRVAVRRPESAAFLKPMGDVGQIVPVAANIRDDASVAAAVEGADTVVNCVGILYQTGRQRFDAVHIDGAARMARAAAAAGVERLVHISALGAAADAPSIYARTKAAGEEAVRAAFPRASIVRPGLVFGPEDYVFNMFAAMSRISPVLPLIGGGNTRFQPVYVDDVATAIRHILGDASRAGQTYELAGPRVYSFRELIETVLEVCGRRRLLVPVPFFVMGPHAVFVDMLPAILKTVLLENLKLPMITSDQLRQLRVDNVAGGELPGLADLGITANGLQAVLSGYLRRHRRPGLRQA